MKSRNGCITLSTVSQILTDLGGDVALACKEEIISNPKAYVDRKIDESVYEDWRDFHRDYISISLLSKWEHFDLGVDRDAIALEKFLQSEQQCREANRRIARFNRTVFSLTDRLPSVINQARGKIEALLGDFSWDRAWPYMGFGPGSSTDLTRAQGDSFYKFGLRSPSTTGANADLAACCVSMISPWETWVLENSEGDSKRVVDCLTIVDGNSVTTVPKNAKTNRVIAVEPTMNMFVQKGLGGLLRRLLKRRGVNLDSQERNRELAQAGSRFGKLATVDLSSASDSISLGLLDLLFATDWADAFKACRSPIGTLPDGTKIRYEKVSSMGNGNTFELESLIFWAIAASVASHLNERESDVSIYGDDIIVPVSCVDLLQEVLAWLGFSFNQEKSFWSGRFRESCGKHYFAGHDVTPIYIKNRVDNLERKLWLANSIRGLAHRLCGFDYGCDARLLKSYDDIVSGLPAKYRKPSIPKDWGDGALQGDFDEATPRKAPRGLEGWRVQFLARSYKTFTGKDVPMLIKSLFTLSRKHRFGLSSSDDGVEGSRIPLRVFRHVCIKSRHVARWAGFGPWIETC